MNLKEKTDLEIFGEVLGDQVSFCLQNKMFKSSSSCLSAPNSQWLELRERSPSAGGGAHAWAAGPARRF